MQWIINFEMTQTDLEWLVEFQLTVNALMQRAISSLRSINTPRPISY